MRWLPITFLCRPRRCRSSGTHRGGGGPASCARRDRGGCASPRSKSAMRGRWERHCRRFRPLHPQAVPNSACWPQSVKTASIRSAARQRQSEAVPEIAGRDVPIFGHLLWAGETPAYFAARRLWRLQVSWRRGRAECRRRRCCRAQYMSHVAQKTRSWPTQVTGT